MQDPVKRRKIFYYMRSIDSDIVFLQETHSSLDDEIFGRINGVNMPGFQVIPLTVVVFQF